MGKKVMENGEDQEDSCCEEIKQTVNVIHDYTNAIYDHTFQTKDVMELLREDIKHLRKLEILEDIKTHLIDAATGRDQVPIEVVLKIVKIFGITIGALTATIVFLLVGHHFDWWKLIN